MPCSLLKIFIYILLFFHSYSTAALRIRNNFFCYFPSLKLKCVYIFIKTIYSSERIFVGNNWEKKYERKLVSIRRENAKLKHAIDRYSKITKECIFEIMWLCLYFHCLAFKEQKYFKLFLRLFEMRFIFCGLYANDHIFIYYFLATPFD